VSNICPLRHKQWLICFSGADLRQKAFSDTLRERSPLPSLLLHSLSSLSLFSPLSSLPPFPSHPLPLFLPSVRSRPLKSSYGFLGIAVSYPVGSGAEPQPKSNLVHFCVKISRLVATILMIF